MADKLTKLEVSDPETTVFAFGDQQYLVSGGIVALPLDEQWVKDLLSNGVVRIPQADAVAPVAGKPPKSSAKSAKAAVADDATLDQE